MFIKLRKKFFYLLLFCFILSAVLIVSTLVIFLEQKTPQTNINNRNSLNQVSKKQNLLDLQRKKEKSNFNNQNFVENVNLFFDQNYFQLNEKKELNNSYNIIALFFKKLFQTKSNSNSNSYNDLLSFLINASGKKNHNLSIKSQNPDNATEEDLNLGIDLSEVSKNNSFNSLKTFLFNFLQNLIKDIFDIPQKINLLSQITTQDKIRFDAKFKEKLNAREQKAKIDETSLSDEDKQTISDPSFQKTPFQNLFANILNNDQDRSPLGLRVVLLSETEGKGCFSIAWYNEKGFEIPFWSDPVRIKLNCLKFIPTFDQKMLIDLEKKINFIYDFWKLLYFQIPEKDRTSWENSKTINKDTISIISDFYKANKRVDDTEKSPLDNLLESAFYYFTKHLKFDVTIQNGNIDQKISIDEKGTTQLLTIQNDINDQKINDDNLNYYHSIQILLESLLSDDIRDNFIKIEYKGCETTRTFVWKGWLPSWKTTTTCSWKDAFDTTSFALIPNSMIVNMVLSQVLNNTKEILKPNFLKGLDFLKQIFNLKLNNISNYSSLKDFFAKNNIFDFYQELNKFLNSETAKKIYDQILNKQLGLGLPPWSKTKKQILNFGKIFEYKTQVPKYLVENIIQFIKDNNQKIIKKFESPSSKFQYLTNNNFKKITVEKFDNKLFVKIIDGFSKKHLFVLKKIIVNTKTKLKIIFYQKNSWSKDFFHNWFHFQN